MRKENKANPSEQSKTDLLNKREGEALWYYITELTQQQRDKEQSQILQELRDEVNKLKKSIKDNPNGPKTKNKLC